MNAVAATPLYGVRAGDVARDREGVLGIWRGNLGDDARMPAKYDWFYRASPAGAPLLQLLTADGRDVGTCAAGRRRMLRDGRPLHGGVLVDLAVLPEHRSLGPALMLQQGLFASARRELDLLYGFPNPKAAPVFKRIGYRPLGHMARHVRVLRHAPYLARRLPRALAPLSAPAGVLVDAASRMRLALLHAQGRALRTTWVARADARMQAIWDASVKPDGIVAVRDLEHLRWRFDHAPSAGFRYLLASRRGDDAPVAWFAVRTSGNALHVHDYWSLQGAAVGTRALLALLSAARAERHVAVSVELATSQAHLMPWRALGFEERSRRPIFGNWGDAAGDPAPDLHLTAADEDE